MGRGLSEQQKDILRFMLALHRHHGGTDHPRYDRIDQPETFIRPVAIFDTPEDPHDFSLERRDEFTASVAALYVCGAPLSVLEKRRLSNAGRAALARSRTRLIERGLVQTAYWRRRFGWRYIGEFLTGRGIEEARKLPPMQLPHIDFVLEWSRRSKNLRDVLLYKQKQRKPVKEIQTGDGLTVNEISVKQTPTGYGLTGNGKQGDAVTLLTNTEWLPVVTEHGVIEVRP